MAEETKKNAPELYQQVISEIPMRKLGDPYTDIAPAVLFFVSEFVDLHFSDGYNPY